MSATVLEDTDFDPDGPAPKSLKVGLLGCGTVGAPIAGALLYDGENLKRAAGTRLELVRVAVRDPGKVRPVRLPPEIVTTDALAVAIDPEIDIVIEVIGGIEPALGSIRGALADNKSVITANKELLGGPGGWMIDNPEGDLHFEASVGGAIPIVRTLRESCAGDHIVAFSGILSGTCNFVLGEMTAHGCSLGEALDEARRLGYAEADPTADVEAFDAAAKVAILARVALGVSATTDHVERTGISGIEPTHIATAAEKGLVYKLVGGARRVGDCVHLWVEPQLVASDSLLARVEGPENAVIVETARGGRLLLHGSGAGGEPTAAAILGDLVTAARRRVRKRTPVPECF